jgi:hypothetical protein
MISREVCSSCRAAEWGTKSYGMPEDWWGCPAKDRIIYAADRLPKECTHKMEQGVAAAIVNVDSTKGAKS